MAQFTFNSGNTAQVDLCILATDNVVVVYRDQATLNIGKFGIYTSAGVAIIEDVDFSGSHNCQYLRCDTLTNGNFVIVYRDNEGADTIRFCVYSPVGVEVVAPVTIATALTTDTCVTALANGNFMVFYRTYPNGYVAVYQADGTQVTAPTLFNNNASYMQSCLLDSGEVFVAYHDDDNAPDDGVFEVLTVTGGSSVAQTQFEAGAVKIYARPVLLDNGNVFITYNDDDDSDKGKFAIHQADGTQVKAPTEFYGSTMVANGATLTSRNTVLIPYRDASNAAKYVVYDEDGAVVVTEQQFSSLGTVLAVAASFSGTLDVIASKWSDGTLDILDYGFLFSPPADIITNKRLIAFSHHTLYYGDI